MHLNSSRGTVSVICFCHCNNYKNTFNLKSAIQFILGIKIKTTYKQKHHYNISKVNNWQLLQNNIKTLFIEDIDFFLDDSIDKIQHYQGPKYK